MKALFLSLPLHGHTNPSLPLVKELVGRGDEIVYCSTAAFAAAVNQAGARYQPYRAAFLKDMQRLPERMDQLSWLIMRTTAEVLDRELDAFRAERPDYVITDSVAPWGQWVARILRVPAVTSISTFAFNRHVAAFGVSHGVRPKSARILLSKLRHTMKAFRIMRGLRRRYGVSGPGLMGSIAGSSDLNIVYTSRVFQPCADTFDDRYQFVGPSIAPRSGPVTFPWQQLNHPVIVYISFGTLFNADAAFYRRCFEAFRSEDVQVVMSIGANVSVESLSPVPPNFIVQPHVPQLEVLERASAFVTHGGMNSVSESLYYAVPVVVIPQMSEQEIVGRRVEELGAGLFLSNAEATADKLRGSVQRLLAENQFRERAVLVRESFKTAGGVVRAAAAIRAFAARLTAGDSISK